jgi:hypothetical protein
MHVTCPFGQEFELDTFKEMQDGVEKLYHNHRPRHHLPSARDLEWHPDDPTQSSVFVTDFVDFDEMEPATIQDIFRHRHILVLNMPFKGTKFSLAALSQLRDIQTPIQMQGESPTSPRIIGSHSWLDMSMRHDVNNCHLYGTMADYYKQSQIEDTGRILNILSIPLGHAITAIPALR